MIYQFQYHIDAIQTATPLGIGSITALTPIIFLRTELKQFKQYTVLNLLDYYLLISILQRPNSLSAHDKSVVKLVCSRAQKEINATGKLPGYSVLSTKTLEIFWISEYDYNYITGYYDNV